MNIKLSKIFTLIAGVVNILIKRSVKSDVLKAFLKAIILVGAPASKK